MITITDYDYNIPALMFNRQIVSIGSCKIHQTKLTKATEFISDIYKMFVALEKQYGLGTNLSEIFIVPKVIYICV